MRPLYAFIFGLALFLTILPRCYGQSNSVLPTLEAYFPLLDQTIIDLYLGNNTLVEEALTLGDEVWTPECSDFVVKNAAKGVTPYYDSYHTLNDKETQSIRGPDGPVYIVVLDVYCYQVTSDNKIIKDLTSALIANLNVTKQQAFGFLPDMKKAFDAYVNKTGGVRTGSSKNFDTQEPPKGITLQKAYIAADVNDARQLDNGKVSPLFFIQDKGYNFFGPQCQAELNAYNGPGADSSYSFTTTYYLEDETKKLGVKYMFVLDVACCVVTKNVTSTQRDIGKLLKDATTDAIKAIHWLKEDALSQAKKTQKAIGEGGGKGANDTSGKSGGGKGKNGKGGKGKGGPQH